MLRIFEKVGLSYRYINYLILVYILDLIGLFVGRYIMCITGYRVEFSFKIYFVQIEFEIKRRMSDKILKIFRVEICVKEVKEGD